MLLSFVLAQAVSASPPEWIDVLVPQPCRAESGEAGEVVVWANRSGVSPYRLKQPAPPPAKAMPQAQVEIAEGVSAAAETEQTDVGGFPSNRAMVRLKIKFWQKTARLSGCHPEPDRYLTHHQEDMLAGAKRRRIPAVSICPKSGSAEADRVGGPDNLEVPGPPPPAVFWVTHRRQGRRLAWNRSAAPGPT
jgi:hypothetical protein